MFLVRRPFNNYPRDPTK